MKRERRRIELRERESSTVAAAVSARNNGRRDEKRREENVVAGSDYRRCRSHREGSPVSPIFSNLTESTHLDFFLKIPHLTTINCGYWDFFNPKQLNLHSVDQSRAMLAASMNGHAVFAAAAAPSHHSRSVRGKDCRRLPPPPPVHHRSHRPLRNRLQCELGIVTTQVTI